MQHAPAAANTVDIVKYKLGEYSTLKYGRIKVKFMTADIIYIYLQAKQALVLAKNLQQKARNNKSLQPSTIKLTS